MNLKITDCYTYTTEEIRSLVKEFYEQGKLGKKRSKHSYVKEWYAHKILYKLGYKRERTKDADLNEDETLWHRIGYTFIYCILGGWVKHS